MDIQTRFCEYFRQAANISQRIGIELEHFVMAEQKPLAYLGGVLNILNKIKDKFIDSYYENGFLLGLEAENFYLSLEPGAQLEVSTKPFDSLDEARSAFEKFYEIIAPALKEEAAKLLCVPVLSEDLVDSIKIIPKKRYEYMDKYFEKTGKFGKYMMRATASAQVSVDYSSERDFVRKYRAAYIMSPFLALLSADSLASDGNYLKRVGIWRGVDPCRTAIVPDLFSDDFGFSSYTDYLLKIPAIFIPSQDGFIYTGEESMRSISGRVNMDEAMIEHFLSMVFPDIRLKKYIEIRIADSMPYEKALAYAGLIKNIFYNEDLVDGILEKYKNVGICDIIDAQTEAQRNGKNAQIYGRHAGGEISNLLDDAAKYGKEEEFKSLLSFKV